MKYTFVDESWDDYLYWQKTDKKMLKRINDILKDISGNPFSGIGKPEPLKFKYKGYWSRRIDEEHRLIYQVKNDFMKKQERINRQEEMLSLIGQCQDSGKTKKIFCHEDDLTYIKFYY